MQDKFEKFISDHRNAFDDQSPPPMAWQRIQQGMQKPSEQKPAGRIVGLWKVARIAAAVLFLLCIGFVVGKQTAPKSDLAIAPEIQELQQVERYYLGKADRQLKQLASYSFADQVKIDLQEMDVFLNELRADLEKAEPGERQAIINAMMDNYKARVEILERVLQKVEPNISKTQKKKQNEGLDI